MDFQKSLLTLTENSEENDGETSWQGESAFVPSSTGELLVTAVMVIPALLVLVYAMVAFYHCVCSRNYAEWRASWWGQEGTWDESSQVNQVEEGAGLLYTSNSKDHEWDA